MSTLKTVNIQHPSSASVNASTDVNGNFLINSGYGSLAPTYGCRAWVNFDGTGTYSPNPSTSKIRASGNVTSVYKNGTGSYTVNFTTAMPDDNYAITFGTNRPDFLGGANSVQTTTSFGFNTRNGGNIQTDISGCFAAIFR